MPKSPVTTIKHILYGLGVDLQVEPFSREYFRDNCKNHIRFKFHHVEVDPVVLKQLNLSLALNIGNARAYLHKTEEFKSDWIEDRPSYTSLIVEVAK